MRAVFGLVLVLGMGLAGFAVYMVKGYMSDQEAALYAERQRSQQSVETIDVYAVNRDVAYGETLTPDDVTLIKYAVDFLPEGPFKTEEELFPLGPEAPRSATRAMIANEPVLASKVTGPGETAGITQRLQPGTRAFTINVSATSGVSSFVRPGDRVDVYWTGTVGGGAYGESREITRRIQNGVELIAVNQSTDTELENEEIPRTLTVQVSQNDVLGLAQLQATGTLSMSLVGNGDTTEASVIEVDQASLLGLEQLVPEAAPVPQAAPQTCSIRTRRGAEVVEIPIPCTN